MINDVVSGGMHPGEQVHRLMAVNESVAASSEELALLKTLDLVASKPSWSVFDFM